MTMNWNGVMPAITTPFTADGDVDHAFLDMLMAGSP